MLTLEAVAREAGVSKGGLLYHFPTKEVLIMAIVERLADRCEADQALVMGSDEEDVGRFTRAYLAIRARPLKPEEEPMLTALLAAVGTDKRYIEPMRKRLLEWQSRLESDGLPPAAASVVRLAIDGLCLGQLLGLPVPEGELRQRVLDLLVAMTRPDRKSER